MHPLQRSKQVDLVEIGANWYVDDLPPMMFIKKSPNSHGFVNPRHLEEMWRDEFDWVYREMDYAVFPICGCRPESVVFCRIGKRWPEICRAVCQTQASKLRAIKVVHHPCVKAVSRLRAVAGGQPLHWDGARPTIDIEISGRGDVRIRRQITTDSHRRQQTAFDRQCSLRCQGDARNRAPAMRRRFRATGPLEAPLARTDS